MEAFTTKLITLDKETFNKLSLILKKDLGNLSGNLNDEEVNELGVILLELTSLALKRKGIKVESPNLVPEKN